VIEDASRLPGFYGAYFAGSTSWLPDDAVLPATSDLDVNVVFTGRDAPHERGKLVHRGALLELTPLSLEELRSADLVLGHYHLAGGLSRPGVILDPSGHLTRLQEEVSRKYARREWVRRRCEHARRRVLEGLAAMDESAPLHEQVIGWIFPTGVTAHLLLVAGLRNPTVRRRYPSAREALAGYPYLPF